METLLQTTHLTRGLETETLYLYKQTQTAVPYYFGQWRNEQFGIGPNLAEVESLLAVRVDQLVRQGFAVILNDKASA
jgi:hypothetical protein